MAFEDDLDEKSPIKKVSSKQSIFDSMPKKPKEQDFQEKVAEIEKTKENYNSQSKELISNLNKIISDRTLKENKSPISTEIEKEVLSKLLKLSSQINNDDAEEEGMGSLLIIAAMLKIMLSQRDRLNELEYKISKLT